MYWDLGCPCTGDWDALGAWVQFYWDLGCWVPVHWVLGSQGGAVLGCWGPVVL